MEQLAWYKYMLLMTFDAFHCAITVRCFRPAWNLKDDWLTVEGRCGLFPRKGCLFNGYLRLNLAAGSVQYLVDYVELVWMIF